MTSKDDRLDALIAQGRVVELPMNYGDLQQKLAELADWSHKVGNLQGQLATIPEHGIVSREINKLVH